MFRMIGFGENLGSGFPLILSAWNEKHWLKPELIEQRELMQVKLVLSIETRDVVKELPDFVKDFVKELPNNLLGQLSERQLEILSMIAADSTISAKAISEKMSEKVSEKMSEKNTNVERTIERDLAKLKKLGILIREGGLKEGHWVIIIDR